nr:hypothetical protein [Tanacetum cinerariifolium]
VKRTKRYVTSSVVADNPSSVVADKVDVVKDKVDVVADKASDALKNKLIRKGKKLVIVLRLSKQEENPKVKAKVNVKRKMILSKEDDRKNKLEGNSKKDVSDFELETDVVDYSSDEADRKRKKLKIKAGLKRKRSGSDSSDSSKIDTKIIKLLISKLENKVEKEVFDEESLPKKGNKKLTKKVKEEESDEDSNLKKGDKIEVTPSKIHDMLGVPFGGYSLFDMDERENGHEFVRKWGGQFYPLELKKFRVNYIAQKLIVAQEIDFLLKVNFVTLFMNTMGNADGLKGQICLDVVRRLREDYSTKFDKFSVVHTRPAIRNWSSYLMKQRQELELKDHVVGLLDLHDKWNEVEVQESKGFIGFSETSEKEFVALHEKYVNLFKDLISFEDDGNRDNVGDDDDENGDDDGGNVDNDANDCDGNGDEEDMNEGDKDPNGSNPSFGFSNISLEDFGNDSEKNVDLVGEVIDCVTAEYLYATLEAMNQEITPEKLPTQKGSPNPKKRAVKPSSYLLSPYMNKKTNVVPKITKLEFILGNSLFAMQGDKMVIQSKSHEIHSETHSKSMFDRTLASFDAKCESFSNQVNAQFKGNKDGLALGGIELKSKGNFHDYGIFTMLHMETFDGGPTSNLDCRLPVESKMLKLAKEFDKIDPVEKMAIIIQEKGGT